MMSRTDGIAESVTRGAGSGWPHSRTRILAGALLLVSFVFVAGSSRSEAEEQRPYVGALALYRAGDWPAAAAEFTELVRADEKSPETLKARYFLVRCQMRLGRWQEASEGLISLYQISPAFYSQWSCDFLLGQCRRALGQD